MRVVTLLLLILLVFMQIPLWTGERSLFKKRELQAQLQRMESKNQELRESNQTLALAVVDLRSGLAAVEEVARRKLGMVRKDEIFVHAPPQDTQR